MLFFLDQNSPAAGHRLQLRHIEIDPDILVDHLGDHTGSIVWFVKIPATNKLYSCSWEGGFAGFTKDDAVKLIHKKSDDAADGDYSGFIVGLHGQQAGRSALVWPLDVDDLMRDLDVQDTDER